MMKNKTAFGAKMLKMNNDVYSLRRNVMDVIYRAKRVVDLPRIELRVVQTVGCNMGYAYMGRNIIHIGQQYAANKGGKLDAVVLHEIVHAVKGVGHIERCPLMRAVYRDEDEAVVWNAFKRYF